MKHASHRELHLLNSTMTVLLGNRRLFEAFKSPTFKPTHVVFLNIEFDNNVEMCCQAKSQVKIHVCMKN